MKFKDLQTKPINELQTILTEERDKLRELRFKVTSKQIKNVRELREIRKNIAQILTVLNQKNKTEVIKEEAKEEAKS